MFSREGDCSKAAARKRDHGAAPVKESAGPLHKKSATEPWYESLFAWARVWESRAVGQLALAQSCTCHMSGPLVTFEKTEAPSVQPLMIQCVEQGRCAVF